MHNFYTRSAFPFTIFIPASSCVKTSVPGTNWGKAYVVLRNESFEFYADREKVLSIGETILKKAAEDGFEGILSEWRPILRKPETFSKGRLLPDLKS